MKSFISLTVDSRWAVSADVAAPVGSVLSVLADEAHDRTTHENPDSRDDPTDG